MHLSPFINLSLLGAVVLPVAHASAQSSTRVSSALDLDARVQREGVDLWQGATRLAPSLRLDQRFAQLSLDGSIVGSDKAVMLDHGTVDAGLSPAPIGAFRLSVDGRAERLASSLYSPRTVLSIGSSLSLATGAGGAWFGAAMEGSSHIDSMRAQPLLRFGLWRQFGSTVITVTTVSHSARLGGKANTYHTQQFPDSIFNDTTRQWNYFERSKSFGDSGQLSRTKLWSELEIGASWSRGPVALDAAFGARPAVDVFPRAFWGRLSAAVQATPSVAFIASAGNDPTRITIGIPQARVVALGVRLSTAALLRPARATPVRPITAAFELRPLGANTYVVSIRAPRARTVELSGDFGRWQPVALCETHPDVWETTLTLAPGTYRMNVRIDGDQWKAPPGMATVADEFNGTVGIVVVR